jgi:hypothetical protein
MAQPIQAPSASPGSPPSPAPSGKAPGLVQAFVAVLTKPGEFYCSVRDVGGFGAPVIFALVMGVASGVVSAVLMVLGLGAAAGAMGGAIGAAAGFASLVTSPIIAVIGCFVGGAIVHLISLIAGGKGSYEQSVRVAGYAAAVMPIGALLGFVPLLSVVPSLYGLYLVAQGLIAIHAADGKKTYVSVGVLAALLVLFSIVGMLAGRAAQEMSREMEGRFGQGSEFQREMQKAQQEMQKAMEEMKKQQEQQQQK